MRLVRQTCRRVAPAPTTHRGRRRVDQTPSPSSPPRAGARALPRRCASPGAPAAGGHGGRKRRPQPACMRALPQMCSSSSRDPSCDSDPARGFLPPAARQMSNVSALNPSALRIFSNTDILKTHQPCGYSQMSRPSTNQPYGYSPFSRTLNPRLKHNLGGQSINKHAQHIVARFGPEQRRTHPDLSLPILLAVVACQSNVGVLFGTCACAHLLCESVNARVKERARERARSILSVRGNGRWVQLSFSTQTKKMSPGSVSVCQYYPICMSLTLYVPTKKLSPFSNGSMLFNASKSVSTYTPPKRSITCVCIHACTQVSMHACIYVCKHVCTYVCMHTCMHADMHVCMYASIYACMQTFIPHACTHLCTRTCMICTFYVLRTRGFGVCADACIFCFAFPPAKQPFVFASVGKKNQEKTSRRTTSESSA